MIETSSPEPSPSTAACGGKKKSKCVVLGIVVLLLIAVPLAFSFCPWFSRMHANANPHIAQIETQLADVDSRLKALEARVNAMNGSATPAATPVPQAQSGDTAKSPAEIARLQADIVALSSALSALQTEMKQAETATAQNRETMRQLLAAAISFIQLREAVLTGQTYTNELTALHGAIGSDASFQEPLAKLEPYAAQGVPTFSRLREELTAREADAANSIDKTQAQNWWQRVLAELKGLISIRPLHGTQQSDAFAALETALDKGDDAAALNAFNGLPPEAQQSLNDWHSKLTAKTDADDALRHLAAHFTANATAQAAP